MKVRREMCVSVANTSSSDLIGSPELKDVIEGLQESLPNMDLSLDGKLVQASVIKPVDDQLMQMLYKSTSKSFGRWSSTLSPNVSRSNSQTVGDVPPKVFHSLSIQVSYCDSYRNIVWNSASLSATLDSTFAKLNFKVTKTTYPIDDVSRVVIF